MVIADWKAIWYNAVKRNLAISFFHICIRRFAKAQTGHVKFTLAAAFFSLLSTV
jgi:hypothetical protein